MIGVAWKGILKISIRAFLNCKGTGALAARVPLQFRCGGSLAPPRPFARGIRPGVSTATRRRARGRSPRSVTLKQGLIDAGFDVACEPATGVWEEKVGGINRAVKLAKECDAVVLAIGEDSTMSGEAACRQNIVVPEVQMALARALKATGKPLIVVLTTGRPLVLEELDKMADALLCGWFPGTEAGHALADLLSGKENPSGRLCVTFPRSVGQIPMYYNHMNTGRPWNGDPNGRFFSRYHDGPNDPLYAFGYGLSYSEFRITEAALSAGEIGPGESVKVQATVENTSDVDGTAVMQVYLHDVAARIARPVKELKDFARVVLKAGESRKVEFTLTPEKMSYYDGTQWVAEPGRFEVMVGLSSDDAKSEKMEFELHE